VDEALHEVEAMVPALLFLLAAVPLAHLLDRLGFFDAVALTIEARWAQVPVLALWVLAAMTTAVLNLDTTVVLLTPLYVRLARRSGSDPLALALIPLLLAGLASSFLPVSNLTTLIVVERLDVSVVEVVAHLALPSLVACTVGWWCYRRRHPMVVHSRAEVPPPDGRVLRVGGALVAVLLLAFVVGPLVGVDPWIPTLLADLVLVALLRHVPWRAVPLATAAVVAALGLVTSLVVSDDLLRPLLASEHPGSTALTIALGTGTSDVVNNLPAVLVAVDSAPHATWGLWGWLLGANVGSLLVPIGALANLLWWRILRTEQVPIDLRTYLRSVVPVALPALLASGATLLLLQLLFA
jgi:arsenical pump membrane protein